MLTQAAFLAALVVFFVAVTAFWVHVERSRGRHRDALSRVGRIAGALVLTVIALPGLALMPLFALREGLPAEAGLDDVIRPAMVLLLISLALVALVNVAGVCFLTGTAAWRRLFGRACDVARGIVAVGLRRRARGIIRSMSADRSALLARIPGCARLDPDGMAALARRVAHRGVCAGAQARRGR